MNYEAITRFTREKQKGKEKKTLGTGSPHNWCVRANGQEMKRPYGTGWISKTDTLGHLKFTFHKSLTQFERNSSVSQW